MQDNELLKALEAFVGAIAKHEDDFTKQIDANIKDVFVPLPLIDKWTYLAGKYFKYNGREIAILVATDNAIIPCDPNSCMAYVEKPVSRLESAEYVMNVLRIWDDDSYRYLQDGNSEGLRKAQEHLGPKPPTYYFDEDDPTTQKVWDKIMEEQGH